MVSTMSPVFIALLALLASTFRTRAAQQAEILALRHQIAVLQQSAPRRLRLKQSDRLLWILLSRFWPGWRRRLRIVQPDTVVRWHRRAFVGYWTWKSRRRPGRPAVPAAIRALIQTMGRANVLWGAPRIHGELLKLGIKRGSIDRGQISAPKPQVAIPDLATILEQPHAADGVNGLLYRADCLVPGAVRLRGALP